MAKVIKGILGGYSGKLGDTVGIYRNGKHIIQQAPPKVDEYERTLRLAKNRILNQGRQFFDRMPVSNRSGWLSRYPSYTEAREAFSKNVLEKAILEKKLVASSFNWNNTTYRQVGNIEVINYQSTGIIYIKFLGFTPTEISSGARDLRIQVRRYGQEAISGPELAYRDPIAGQIYRAPSVGNFQNCWLIAYADFRPTVFSRGQNIFYVGANFPPNLFL